MDVLRTPDARFAALRDFPYVPHWCDWQGLRVAYVDEGPRDGAVVLLLHGEPTWSYLYRHVIRVLAAAGFRCVAPDYVGFGRSDKVVADDWYVVERHVETVRHLIETLDLRGMTLVCQDWGGPIGLRQVLDMPERFARLVIMNTWLHHDGFVYGDGIRSWRSMATDPARLGGDLPAGRVVAGTLARPGHAKAAVVAAYDAPFPGPEYKAGVRRFPWCIPFAEPEAGGAEWQARAFAALERWDRPAHFVWGDADPIFPWTWGERWAARVPGATLDRIAGASHFLQEDAGADVAAVIRRRLG